MKNQCPDLSGKSNKTKATERHYKSENISRTHSLCIEVTQCYYVWYNILHRRVFVTPIHFSNCFHFIYSILLILSLFYSVCPICGDSEIGLDKVFVGVATAFVVVVNTNWPVMSQTQTFLQTFTNPLLPQKHLIFTFPVFTFIKTSIPCKSTGLMMTVEQD